MAAVEIVIVGLCSLLNVRNEYATLPEPSVIAVRTGQTRGHTKKHIPYIAWNSDDIVATFDPPSKFTEEHVSGADNFHFIAMDGESVTLTGDKSGSPDATEFKDIAGYLRYARDPASTDWDRCYIPEKGNAPQSKCVAGYMKFGGGALTTDRLTDYFYHFEDDAGDTGLQPTQYAQEVIYTTIPSGDTTGKAYEEFVLSQLDNPSSKRTLRLTANTAGKSLLIFFGNHVPMDIVHAVRRQNSSSGNDLKALHFHALGLEINDSDVPVPVLDEGFQPRRGRPASNRPTRRTRRPAKKTAPATPSDHPSGDSTGYCGPDSKP